MNGERELGKRKRVQIGEYENQERGNGIEIWEIKKEGMV